MVPKEAHDELVNLATTPKTIYGCWYLLSSICSLHDTHRLNFWHTYQHALTTCKTTDTCNQLPGNLLQSNIDGLLLHLVRVAIMFLPILLGLFWGVPLLSKEYVEGTNKLVWTQSISRRKWLSVKLVW